MFALTNPVQIKLGTPRETSSNLSEHLCTRERFIVYLQDARKQVRELLQQGCVPFICKNKGRCRSSGQGTYLKGQENEI